MSEEQELERLRADLEVLERYFCDGCARVVQDKIAEIEKAAADPWREAKDCIERWRKHSCEDYVVGEYGVVAFVDQLNSEIKWLSQRIAELDKDNERVGKKCNELYEAKRNAESQRDRAWKRIAELEGVKDVADMQPLSDGPIVGIEPVLDPARVLATAAEIARLEAAADPWREAKNRIEIWRAHGNSSCVVSYVDHLTTKAEAQRKQIDYLHREYEHRGLQISELVAENARLTKRVAELEAAASDVTALLETTDEASDPSTDTYVAVTVANAAIADMQPQPERPIESIEPVLDPARVLATAAEIFDQKGQFSMRMAIAFYCQGAKPYRLKGAGDE